jgi:putative ABC transport system permease protein
MKPKIHLWSSLYENAVLALQSIRANKLRSFLTVTGVVIGVWTVMAIASIISGIDTAVKKEVESFGVNSIFLFKFETGVRLGKLSREERMRKDLNYDDAMAIANLPAIKLSVPFLNISNDPFGNKLSVTANGKSSDGVRLEGTLPDYMNTGQEVLEDGRFFTQYENDTNQLVCVMRAGATENFFPFTSPVGQTIKIGGYEFRVVGALNRRELMLFNGSGSDDLNNGIFIPFNVARKLKPSATDTFILAMSHPGLLEDAKDQVTDLLRVRRQVHFDEPNNFGMSTAESIVDQFRSITSGVAIGMVAVSSIGLLVGGIGVMNIMLVTVTERTHEIGLRKAIGARRRDILRQFLCEAMVLTGLGGLCGILIGWATTLLIRLFIPSYVPLWAPIVGLVASVSIGLFFGFWPAWKAAGLDPIEALRYE